MRGEGVVAVALVEVAWVLSSWPGDQVSLLSRGKLRATMNLWNLKLRASGRRESANLRSRNRGGSKSEHAEGPVQIG
jgi:hypothetical protein